MKTVTININVEGLHYWPDCNIKEVYYLKHSHRHTFNIAVTFKIEHNDRDVEFICAKHKLKSFLDQEYYSDYYKLYYFGDRSCETIAENILECFKEAIQCSVGEDNEFFATISR